MIQIYNVSAVVYLKGSGQPLTLITTIPVTTEHRDINEDEDDDEPVDRSRSPSPLSNIFCGPIIKCESHYFYFVSKISTIVNLSLFLFCCRSHSVWSCFQLDHDLFTGCLRIHHPQLLEE